MRFFVAIAAAAALILSAPFIGQIRTAIRTAFPGQFVAIVAGAVALPLVGAIVLALARIRERRALRYGLIVAALVIGVTYAAVIATGNPEVDAVEHVHFVEYGLVTLLFYRAWRPRGDAAVLVLPILAGILVGTLEEWFQWFVPVRVGEVRDVFLNCAAIVCGLLFSVAIDPPPRFSLTLRRGSLALIGTVSAVVIGTFALFFQSVHLGSVVKDPEAGTFRSRYDRATLVRLAQERASTWKIDPPIVLHRFSREDQYMTEALQHVQERNRRWDAGDVAAAWHENRILEKFYEPVLDTPSYVSRNGHRWPPEQRKDAERRIGVPAGVVPDLSRTSNTTPTMGSNAIVRLAGTYSSNADQQLIRTWPKAIFWSVVALLASAVLVTTFLMERRHDL